MRPIGLYLWLLGCFIAVSSLATGAATTSIVSTLAGSGFSGNEDGSAQAAQFVMPAGLAEDAAGNLFIADAGGQRIRVLTSDNTVRTIAGSGPLLSSGLWSAGGYRDGSVAIAQFNHPSGIAIGSDGALYIADTLNHCIRKIFHGQVTTFAGRPPFSGRDDGERTIATFKNPRALTFADDGTLFVADYGVGLREISPQGIVRTVSLPPGIDPRIVALSLYQSNGQRVLFISTWNALLALDAQLHPIWIRRITPPKAGPRLFNEIGQLRSAAITESREAFGHPFALSALDGGGVLYTDLHTHSIGYFRRDGTQTTTAILSHWPIPDAANRSGGYHDGPLSAAQFDAPLAILQRRSGAIVVADSGNRRLREFFFDPNSRLPTPPPSRHIARNDTRTSGEINLHALLFPRLSRRFYRIAFLGNSYSYWDTRWKQSIEGLVEQRLNADRKKLGLRKPVKVTLLFPYFETLASVESYAREALSQRPFDAVIWQINQQTVALEYGRELARSAPGASSRQITTAFATFWQPRLRASLKRIRLELERNGVRLFIALHPIGLELTPLEDAELEEYEEPFYPTNGFTIWSQSDIGQQLKAAVRAAGVPLIDAYPKFIDAERSPMRRPLFGTLDEHFSIEGRVLAARIIGDYLEAARPWMR